MLVIIDIVGKQWATTNAERFFGTSICILPPWKPRLSNLLKGGHWRCGLGGSRAGILTHSCQRGSWWDFGGFDRPAAAAAVARGNHSARGRTRRWAGCGSAMFHRRRRLVDNERSSVALDRWHGILSWPRTLFRYGKKRKKNAAVMDDSMLLSVVGCGRCMVGFRRLPFSISSTCIIFTNHGMSQAITSL